MKAFILKIFLPFLVLAAIFHLLTINALPNVIMSIAMKKISDEGYVTAKNMIEDGTYTTLQSTQTVVDRKGWNASLPSPRATHEQRIVVRSSADLLYSACAYDLSQGPVQVVAPKGSGYASISAFAANTDNFFVMDDRKDRADHLRALFHLPGQSVDDDQSELIKGASVESPSAKGIILVRYLIEDESKLQDYIDQQYEIKCDPV